MIEGVGNILLVSVCSSWLQWETGQTAAARDPCKYGSQWSRAAAMQHCSTGHCREYNPVIAWEVETGARLQCSAPEGTQREWILRLLKYLQCVPKNRDPC